MQPEFFRAARPGGSGAAAGLSDMDAVIAMLAARGYAGVMDYPLGVFFAALETSHG